MNLATSPNDPPPKPRKLIGLPIVWLGIYTAVVFGLAVVLYSFLLTKMWIVPLLAELVLVGSNWTTSTFWRGFLARLAGLTLGNILAHYCYVVPVIYEGKEPWSEERLWAYLIVAVQTAVAAIAFWIVPRLKNR